MTFITAASLFELDMYTHIATVFLAKDHYRASLNEFFNIKFGSLFSQLDPLQQHAACLMC